MEEKRPWPQGPTDDKQVDGAAKVVAVAVRFAGKPELWTMVDQITRTTQNDETAVAATLLQAAILEQVLLGKPIGEAVALALAQRKAADRPCPAGGDAAVVAAVEEVLAEKPESTHEDILWAFGENCRACARALRSVSSHLCLSPPHSSPPLVSSTLSASAQC